MHTPVKQERRVSFGPVTTYTFPVYRGPAKKRTPTKKKRKHSQNKGSHATKKKSSGQQNGEVSSHRANKHKRAAKKRREEEAGVRHRQGLRHSARYCLYCNGVDPGSDTDDLTDEDEGTVFENTAENTSARDARHSQGGVSECGFQPESATPRHERVSGKRSMNARELLAVDASMDPRRSSTNYGRDDLHRRSAAATPHLPNSSRIRNMPDQVQPSHGDPPPPVPYPSATQVPYPSTFQVPYPGTSANASHHQQTFAIANPRKRTPSPTSIRADPVNGTNNDKVIASRRLYQIRRNGSKAHMQRAVTEAVLRSGESDETWCNAIVRLDSARLHVLYSNMESGGIGDGARALLERATIEEKEIADLRKIAHEEEEDGVWDDGMMDEVLRAVLRLIVK